MAKFVFIAGTGRSGTHLIGRSVGSHPDIEARIEAGSFSLLSDIAARQDFDAGLVISIKKALLILRYRLMALLGKRQYILEKSHPSLWLCEELLRSLPGSKFVGVWRDVEPTVASMLRHRGVQSWYEKLPQDRPNRFLGITEKNKRQFAALSLEEKCALRWLSHRVEILRLERLYPDRFLSVNYDRFVLAQQEVLSEVAQFLDVKPTFDVERIELASLDKWRTDLTEGQLQRIRAAESLAA